MPEGHEKKLRWPIKLLTQKILDYINEQFVKKPHNKYELETLNLNTAIAYELSVLLAKTEITRLPHKILDLFKRAKFIDYVDTTIMANVRLWDYYNKPIDLEVFLNRLVNEPIISNLLYCPNHRVTEHTRVGLILRLWCGCIDAAKMIRLTSTLTARNYAFWKITCERLVTPSERKRDSFHIDTLSQNDPIYCAGAEVGPALKSLRRQYYSLEGVSRESVIRRYSNQYLINTVYGFSNR